MSNPARERAAGHIEIEVRAAVADDVRRAATPVFEEDELRREHELLDRLAARLARGEGAVAGLDDVRDALVQRRVEALLYDEREVASLGPGERDRGGRGPVGRDPPGPRPRGAARAREKIAAILRF